MCLNVKRFTKSFRNRYLFPAIITLYNCWKPKWRMIENMNWKNNLLEIVCCIQTVWYWTDLVLQGVNLILKRHNLKNKKNWPLRRSRFLFYVHLASSIPSPVQTDVTLSVRCYMLRPFTHTLLHFLACCWELLHLFGHHCQRGSNTIRLTVCRA